MPATRCAALCGRFDQRQLRGGSLGDRRRSAFRLDQLRGFGAAAPEPGTGFRLVATREGP